MPEVLYEEVVEVEERVVLEQPRCELQLPTPLVEGSTGEKVYFLFGAITPQPHPRPPKTWISPCVCVEGGGGGGGFYTTRGYKKLGVMRETILH